MSYNLEKGTLQNLLTISCRLTYKRSSYLRFLRFLLHLAQQLRHERILLVKGVPTKFSYSSVFVWTAKQLLNYSFEHVSQHFRDTLNELSKRKYWCLSWFFLINSTVEKILKRKKRAFTQKEIENSMTLDVYEISFLISSCFSLNGLEG